MTTRALPNQQIRISEGVSTAVLLAFLLLSVSGSIVAANWADGLSITAWGILGGLALGVMFAKIDRLPGWIAHLLALGLGVPATAVFASSLLPGAMTLAEKLTVLQERSWGWLLKVISGGASSDNLIFVIQLTFLTWTLGYIAAWFVYRRHAVWGAILPSGAAILFNLFYAAPQNGIYFGLYILCALLLIVRLNLNTMERWWRAESIGYTSDIGFDFLLYGVIFSILVMLVAWLVPAAAPGPTWLSFLEPLQSPWQGVEDQFNRVFGSLRSVARPAPASFFGTTLSMGGPVRLGNRPVLDVETSTGRYWQATVFDKYTGIGWINTHLSTLSLGGDDPRLDQSADAMRVEITQTYKIHLPDQNILYALSQPISFNQSIEIRYGQSPSADGRTPSLDIALVRQRRPLREGDSYTVVSAVSFADEESLRQAPAQYSPWIETNYLQLPDDLPARVRELAKTITTGHASPYDKAVAIERYLRSHITYNEEVSAPPAGRDGVDYTLFERPEGYCNYYASAMVVLARAVGVPARVASGYAFGDNDNGTFRIIEANAHSWVQVYFPNYGWIEFEPTSSKPEIERPKRSTASSTSLDDALEDAEPPRTNRRGRDFDIDEPGMGGSFDLFNSSTWTDARGLAFAGAALIVLLAVGILGVTQWRHLRRMGQLAPAAQFYEKLVARMQWLGITAQKHDTPFERARLFGDTLPHAREQVERATHLYVRERFGAHPLDESERTELSSAWDRVRREWQRALFFQIVDRLTRPPRQFLRSVHRAIERWGAG